MNFDFSSEDRMIQEQVRRFLSEQSPLSRHRSVMEGQSLQASDVWQGLAELGLQGTAIPEAYGGVGAGYLPLCLVAQELGGVLAAVPFSSSVYLATEAITCFGSTEQKERYLPKLASGEWANSNFVSTKIWSRPASAWPRREGVGEGRGEAGSGAEAGRALLGGGGQRAPR